MRADASRPSRFSGVDVPPPGSLTPTGPVDAAAHYGGIGYGTILRQRLKWVRDALPHGKIHRVLDLGYGSGIFFPELAHHARSLFGIDVHPNGARARDELSACGVQVSLARGDGAHLPFRTGSFDTVVIVSALEFIEDPGHALAESFRVTRPGGVVLAITPRPQRWADLAYTMLVGIDPEGNFHGGRDRVQRALETTTLPIARLPRPARLPRALALYELIVIRRPLLADSAQPHEGRGEVIPSFRFAAAERSKLASSAG